MGIVLIIIGVLLLIGAIEALRTSKEARERKAGFFFISLCIALILFGYDLTTDDEVETTVSTDAETEKPWYAGGTLHSVTMRDWHAGTDENRLATSADWAYTFVNEKYGLFAASTFPKKDLKIIAQGIVNCVNSEPLNPALTTSNFQGAYCAKLIHDTALETVSEFNKLKNSQ